MLHNCGYLWILVDVWYFFWLLVTCLDTFESYKCLVYRIPTERHSKKPTLRIWMWNSMLGAIRYPLYSITSNIWILIQYQAPKKIKIMKQTDDSAKNLCKLYELSVKQNRLSNESNCWFCDVVVNQLMLQFSMKHSPCSTVPFLKWLQINSHQFLPKSQIGPNHRTKDWAPANMGKSFN